MKIFLISNMYPSSEQYGYGIFVKNFEDALLKYETNFSLKAVISGRAFTLKDKILKYLKFYYEIISKGLSKDYDFIYVHYGTHAAIPLIILKFLTNKKLIIHVHGADLYPVYNEYAESRNVHRILYPFFKILSKFTDFFVVPSPYYKKELNERLKIKLDNICVYPSGGVDKSVFRPLEKSDCRKKYNIPEDNLIVGFIASIRVGKGWDKYLKALKILKDKGIKFKGVVAGDGLQKQIFLDLIKELELENDVIYLGAKPQKELPLIFNSFDVFIFPTMIESLGLVGLESLACGVPVIGSRIPPLQDYIFEGKNGLLFDKNSIEDLSNKIIEFSFLSKEEKEKYKNNSLEVASNYDSEKVNREIFLKLKEFI